MQHFLALGLILVVIVFTAKIFCNALEHLGEQLRISEGITGSIFAAVGTALPETIIPILSIADTTHNSTNTVNDAIGIGAILGAPLMLSTLSLFIISIFVIKRRGIKGKILPEPKGLQRDLHFFIFGYLMALVASFTQTLHLAYIINTVISITLGLNYFIYVLITVRNSRQLVNAGHNTKASDILFLTKFRFKTNITSIIIQLVIGLFIFMYSAHLFISEISIIGSYYNFSPFLLSLIITPIATELPEKINSITWLREKKDTLAIGNITGAMVFQGSLLPIVGILFSNWNFKNLQPVVGIIITLISTMWLYFHNKRGNIRIWHFWVSGLLYFINIAICSLIS